MKLWYKMILITALANLVSCTNLKQDKLPNQPVDLPKVNFIFCTEGPLAVEFPLGFDGGLQSDAIKEMDRVLKYVRKYADEFDYIEIFSHSDGIGNATYNQKLSEKRAQAVVQYLFEQGISLEKIKVKAMGSSKAVLFEECQSNVNKLKVSAAKKRLALIECNTSDRRIDLLVVFQKPNKSAVAR